MLGGNELIVMFLVSAVFLVVPFVVGSWVIRLAVRHGTVDAHERLAARQTPESWRA